MWTATGRAIIQSTVCGAVLFSVMTCSSAVDIFILHRYEPKFGGQLANLLAVAVFVAGPIATISGLGYLGFSLITKRHPNSDWLAISRAALAGGCMVLFSAFGALPFLEAVLPSDSDSILYLTIESVVSDSILLPVIAFAVPAMLLGFVFFGFAFLRAEGRHAA